MKCGASASTTKLQAFVINVRLVQTLEHTSSLLVRTHFVFVDLFLARLSPAIVLMFDTYILLRYTAFRQFATTPRSNTAQFILQCKHVSPLMWICGWHPSRITFCEMHVVHLGLCQWLNASGVLLLANHGYLGPPPLQSQLCILTSRFNKWCSINRIR